MNSRGVIKLIKIISFTGNRSINIKNNTVLDSLKVILNRYPGAIWRTGMAYGLDLMIAQFAHDNDISFEAHLPFPALIQTSRWNDMSTQLHTMMLTKAIKVIIYSSKFSNAAYQTRNINMALGCDLVVAYNLQSKGGTVNMIEYCISNGICVIDGFKVI